MTSPLKVGHLRKSNSIQLDIVQNSLTYHSTWLFITCTSDKQKIAWLTRFSFSFLSLIMPSVLRRCWLGGRKGIWPVKNDWWGAGMVICLKRGADLHMAQPMTLPLTVSCFIKIQIGIPFWYQLTWVVPENTHTHTSLTALCPGLPG